MPIHAFESGPLPDGFSWLNPPPDFRLDRGLHLSTAARTDFWQGTHYGFRRDDGHFLFTRVDGDFTLSAGTRFEAERSRYDQCGLMVRVDAENWIKLSIEYEDEELSRLGSVVTNLGFSDWATRDVGSDGLACHYRVSRRGADFLLESSFDGERWRQMRIAHLHRAPETLAVGVYACSPVGTGFRCAFFDLELGDCLWPA